MFDLLIMFHSCKWGYCWCPKMKILFWAHIFALLGLKKVILFWFYVKIHFFILWGIFFSACRWNLYTTHLFINIFNQSTLVCIWYCTLWDLMVVYNFCVCAYHRCQLCFQLLTFTLHYNASLHPVVVKVNKWCTLFRYIPSP